MAKPTTLPLWDTAEERTLVPSATQRATGWIWTGSKFEKPKGETLNYWMNNVYKWLKYFDEEVVPSSPIATYEEYTATGGETFITTANNTNLQVYKNGTFLIEDTDYTINVDGVTVDLTVALNVSDFVQWYDLRKLSNTFLDKNDATFINSQTQLAGYGTNGRHSEYSGDLNDITVNSVYATVNPTNAPLNSVIWGIVETNIASDPSIIHQTFSNIGSGNGFYKRIKSGGVWQPWVRIDAGATLGVGQSWQNVTGSRSAGVTYTNTSGKPIQVIVSGSTGSSGWRYLYVDSNAVSQNLQDSATWISLTAIVPNGSTYSTDIQNIANWSELG